MVPRAGRAVRGQARARLAGWRQHGHCRLVERLELAQLVLAQHLEAVDALADYRRYRSQLQLRRHVALPQRLAEAQYRRWVTEHLPVVAQPRRGEARAPARRGRGAALVRSDGGGVVSQQRHAEQGGRAPPPARRIHCHEGNYDRNGTRTNASRSVSEGISSGRLEAPLLTVGPRYLVVSWASSFLSLHHRSARRTRTTSQPPPPDWRPLVDAYLAPFQRRGIQRRSVDCAEEWAGNATQYQAAGSWRAKVIHCLNA